MEGRRGGGVKGRGRKEGGRKGGRRREWREEVRVGIGSEKGRRGGRGEGGVERKS